MADMKGLKKAFEDYRDKVRATLDAKNQEIEDLKTSVQEKIDAAVKADDDGEDVEMQDVLKEIGDAVKGLTPAEAPAEPAMPADDTRGSSG